MIRLTMDQVEPGMEAGMPVYHPHHEGTVLLRPGAILVDATIARLRELGQPELWVRVRGAESVAEYYSTSLIAARAKVSEAFSDLVAKVRGQAGGELSFDPAREAVAELVEQVHAQPKAALFAYEMDRFADPLVRHASAMCYLSILIGHRLGFYLIRERTRVNPAYARDLVPLGLGSLLCDLGIARLPERTQELWARGQEERDPEWRQHTRLGYELVKRRIEPAAASMVLHHHQRWNGTGFPREMRSEGVERGSLGREIHVYARIASAADQFLRLLTVGDPGGGSGYTRGAACGGASLAWLNSGRASARAMPAVRALRLMQSPGYSAQVDTVIMRGLVNAVPAFAPGTPVTLNDGRECVVAGWSPLEPCQPQVIEVERVPQPVPDLFAGLEPTTGEPATGLHGVDGVSGDDDAGFEARPVRAATATRACAWTTVGGAFDLRSEPGLAIALVDGVKVMKDNFFAKHPFAFDLGAIESVLYAPKAPAGSTAAA